MKNLYYVFILSFGIISCSSDGVLDINNSDLVGTWNWTNTDGGIAFQLHETPETIEKTIHLILMENSNYFITENGEEISNGKFQLIMKKSIYSGEKERYIMLPINQQYLGIVTNGIIKVIDKNKLEISDNNYDGVTSKFLRIE